MTSLQKHTTLFALLFMSLSSCVSRDHGRARIRVFIDETTTPWTRLDALNDPEHFQFAIVADRTGGERGGVFEDAVSKLNLLQPEFVVSVGDLIDGYTDDRAQLESEWTEFDSFVNALEMPFFYLPGNHDYTNSVMAEVWAERYGPSFYHFIYRDVLFLCLNSEEPLRAHHHSAIFDEQFEYFQKVLAENPNVRWTLVFMHKPMWLEKRSGRWPDLERLLADRPHTVFAGHRHSYTKYVRHGRPYIILATSGGGSQLRGTHYGEFDHVVWVTMTEKGPRLANLLLEGIWDEDVRTQKAQVRTHELVSSIHMQVKTRLWQSKEQQRSVKIRIRNDADSPWLFQGRLSSSPAIKSSEILETTLAPNSIEELELGLVLERDCEEIKDVTLEVLGKFSTKLEGQPELVVVKRQSAAGICVPLGSILMEAENMRLDGYRVNPSGGALIEAESKNEARAETGFNGPAGNYWIRLTAVPENDGSPRIAIFVNDTKVLEKQLPRDEKYKEPTSDRVHYHSATVNLKTGDKIHIVGSPDGGAPARVDRLVLIPVAGRP